MDKIIKKVAKDVEKKELPKAKTDLRRLLKTDKKQDAKMDKMEKKKK